MYRGLPGRRQVRVLAAVVALSLVTGAAASAVSSTERYGGAKVIGRSVKDRPIEVRQRGGQGGATRVLVVGEIHGNERAGRPVVRELEDRAAPAGVKLWLMRDLNPDGVARGTRQNARGVDLNRNFPRGWKERGKPGSTYYSGPRPLSEPESRAAAELIRRVEPDVTIWYHQALELVDESRGADLSLVRRYARIVGLPSRRLPRLNGNATRWQNHRDPDSSAFVVELAGGRLRPGQVRKHARAVLAVSRLAREPG